jgi:hypothetical protein
MGLITDRSYEDILCDAFEALLKEGVRTAEGFVAGLNERNIHGPKGQKWTMELFVAEMGRLGA